jgi:hypothetical protein
MGPTSLWSFLLQCRPASSPQGDSLGSTPNNKTFSIPPASDRNPANCLCSPPPVATSMDWPLNGAPSAHPKAERTWVFRDASWRSRLTQLPPRPRSRHTWGKTHLSVCLVLYTHNLHFLELMIGHRECKAAMGFLTPTLRQ